MKRSDPVRMRVRISRGPAVFKAGAFPAQEISMVKKPKKTVFDPTQFHIGFAIHSGGEVTIMHLGSSAAVFKDRTMAAGYLRAVADDILLRLPDDGRSAVTSNMRK
jgi:hypothetical protein